MGVRALVRTALDCAREVLEPAGFSCDFVHGARGGHAYIEVKRASSSGRVSLIVAKIVVRMTSEPGQAKKLIQRKAREVLRDQLQNA